MLKISDFGWSIYTEEKRMTFCGTLDYVSPEVVSGKDYDFKVDIWSVGVLTYEIITGLLYLYIYAYIFNNKITKENLHLKMLQIRFKFIKMY